MYFTFLFIFYIIIKFGVLATDICTYQNPCKCIKDNNKVIDLSSIGLPDQPRFDEVLFESDSSLLYSYNPCYPFNGEKSARQPDNQRPCLNAAACVKLPADIHGNFPEEYAIGIQSTAVFGFNNSLYISYSVPESKESLTVHLVCDRTVEHDIAFVDHSGNHLTLNLTTKCACDDVCKSADVADSSGLSTGSKLLIAFFTILLAYLIVGIVWKFCNGAQGIEVIPNLEFWNELPKLIMEGVIFTCSCFSGRSSYGEV